MATQTQTQVTDSGQVAAATAGQQVQQLIVPQEDWPAYVEYIRQKHPDVQATVTPITDEQVKANVEAGTAVQFPPQAGILLKNMAYGFDPNKMGPINPPPTYQASSKEAKEESQLQTGAPQQTTTATADSGNTFADQAVKYDPEQAGIPGVIKGLSKMLMNYAQNEMEEMKMEQNNNNAQAQGQVQQAVAGFQMPEVSGTSIAKGLVLTGGGIILGRYVFGKNPAPAEAGEALMSAAKTLGDADPKAIAGAVGSIAKGVIGKVFGM